MRFWSWVAERWTRRRTEHLVFLARLEGQVRALDEMGAEMRKQLEKIATSRIDLMGASDAKVRTLPERPTQVDGVSFETELEKRGFPRGVVGRG